MSLTGQTVAQTVILVAERLVHAALGTIALAHHDKDARDVTAIFAFVVDSSNSISFYFICRRNITWLRSGLNQNRNFSAVFHKVVIMTVAISAPL